jgi:hypothetical protein
MAGTAPANGILASLISQSARQDKLFAKIDADGNGQISPGELSAFGQNLPSVAASNGHPVQNRFSRMDANGDGAISKSEWQTYGAQRAQARSALLQAQEQSGADPAHHRRSLGRSPVATAVFNQLDTNHDGVVSPEEWAANFGSSNSASVPSASQAPLTNAVNSVMQPVTSAVDTLVQTLNALI